MRRPRRRKAAEPAEPAPPSADAGRRATDHHYNDDGAPQRRDVLGRRDGAPRARRGVAQAPSKTPAPANVVRGWGPAARAPAALPTPERNRAKAAAAARREHGAHSTAREEEGRAQELAYGARAPKFAERKAEPQRLSTEEQQLRARRSARSSRRASRRTRAVPGAAGTARRGAGRRRRGAAAGRSRRPMSGAPHDREALHVRRVAKATVSFRRARLLLSRSDWRGRRRRAVAVAQGAGARTKRRQTLTQPASPALSDQKPAPEAATAQRRRRCARTSRLGSWTADSRRRRRLRRRSRRGLRTLHGAGASQTTRDAREADRHVARQYELSKPAFKARECPGGMARFVFRRPFCVPSIASTASQPVAPRRRQRTRRHDVDTHSRVALAPARDERHDTPHTPRHTRHQRRPPRFTLTQAPTAPAEAAPQQRKTIRGPSARRRPRVRGRQVSKPSRPCETPPMPGW